MQRQPQALLRDRSFSARSGERVPRVDGETRLRREAAIWSGDASPALANRDALFFGRVAFGRGVAHGRQRCGSLERSPSAADRGAGREQGCDAELRNTDGRGQRRPADPFAGLGAGAAGRPRPLRLLRRCCARSAPYIKRADLAICHVETPMTPRPPMGYPVFNTPPALARAIAQDGLADLRHGLEPLGRSGSVRDRSDRPARSIARASCTPGSFASPAAAEPDPDRHGEGRAGRVPCLHRDDERDPAPAPVVGQHRQRVGRSPRGAPARAARGAQVVIVNFHWGDEFVSQPSAFQLSTASALASDPDITAIVGQHVHVVQPIARVHGKLVVFGEGQLLSNESAACCPVQTEDGMLVFLHIVVNGRPLAGSPASATCRPGTATPTTRCCRSAMRCAATRLPPPCCAPPMTGPRPWLAVFAMSSSRYRSNSAEVSNRQ